MAAVPAEVPEREADAAEQLDAVLGRRDVRPARTGQLRDERQQRGQRRRDQAVETCGTAPRDRGAGGDAGDPRMLVGRSG
jgi:hypothetical protein